MGRGQLSDRLVLQEGHINISVPLTNYSIKYNTPSQLVWISKRNATVSHCIQTSTIHAVETSVFFHN